MDTAMMSIDYEDGGIWGQCWIQLVSHSVLARLFPIYKRSKKALVNWFFLNQLQTVTNDARFYV